HNGLGIYHQAIKDLNKALELDPKNIHAYANRGWSYTGLGDDKQAIIDFNKAIELDPGYADGYYNLAVFYAVKGDKQKTLNYLSEAIKLNTYLKQKANADVNFKSLNNDKDFKRLVD
ncbi:tetratricopeptide repeat protein, partial [Thermodesulfobacteriota bacterium]